jgi:hypothetical protein
LQSAAGFVIVPALYWESSAAGAGDYTPARRLTTGDYLVLYRVLTHKAPGTGHLHMGILVLMLPSNIQYK